MAQTFMLQPQIEGSDTRVGDPIDHWRRGFPVGVHVQNVSGVIPERLQPLVLDSPLVSTGVAEHYSFARGHFTEAASEQLRNLCPNGISCDDLVILPNGQVFGPFNSL
jgi:hypothetical protein